MALRFQLINDSLGVKVLSLADPIDINALRKKIKRSKDGGGVIYEMMLDVTFIKDGRRFIQSAYETAGGIDAVVTVNVYEYNPNTYRWKLWATGQINFNKYDIGEDNVIVNIEQTGVERRVLNLMETDVDLETSESESGTALVPLVPIDVNYHSKTILRQSVKETGPDVDYSILTNMPDGPYYCIYGLDKITLNEVEEAFTYPTQFVPQVNPEDQLKYLYEFKEAGSYTITVNANFAFFTAGIPRDFSIQWYLKHGKLGNLTTVPIGGVIAATTNSFVGSPSLVDYVFNVEPGDVLFVYGVLTCLVPNLTMSNPEFDVHGVNPFSINLRAATVFEETTVKGVLLYEAFQRCLQYYTNQTDCFHSELLGRTDLINPITGANYLEDGEASLIMWNNGHRLRGNNEKKIFANLKDLIEFVNARFCVEFGFEVGPDGIQRFRLEKKEHFYNKSLQAIDLGKVYGVRKRVDSSRYYNLIEYGYSSKIDVKQVNGIDAFNTLRKSSIPIINTKNPLKVSTRIKADGYQIESQRRLTYSTEDGKLDDDNFVTVLIRDAGEPSGFRTRTGSLADGYVQASFSNIFDPATGYNYYISPARCLRAWKRFLASGLIRSSRKVVKFSYGEVNYQMTSQQTDEPEIVAENGDVDVTLEDPVFDPEVYTFERRLDRDQLEAIENNVYGYVRFKDQFDVDMFGFINTDNGIDAEPNINRADFELLKVHNPSLG